MALVIPNREQLALLREARTQIKHEFGESLQLSSEDVFQQVYRFAIRSKSEKLFYLHSQLASVAAVSSQIAKQTSNAMYRGVSQ